MENSIEKTIYGILDCFPQPVLDEITNYDSDAPQFVGGFNSSVEVSYYDNLIIGSITISAKIALAKLKIKQNTTCIGYTNRALTHYVLNEVIDMTPTWDNYPTFLIKRSGGEILLIVFLY